MSNMGSRVLIYGGKGALGSVLVNHFKSMKSWVASVDLVPNEDADFNLILSESTLQGQSDQLKKLDDELQGSKLDAIFCVAGGWAGGNAASEDFVKSCHSMAMQSMWTSVLASELSSKHLKDGGVFTLTGAQPALKGTPGMIGYGMAKAAVHQLVASLAEPNSGLPSDSLVVAILPVTLDTPMNRKFMPNADHSTWTPLQFIAELFANWCSGVERPANGSLLQLFTKDGSTSVVPAEK
ncbi:dihydropteridine reductase-like [Watersipora subatra]|uniref:dihydropteridine reductase-like n=1 Tax=Watersipora subatra TaxID=2589382 RepID=UPI00355C17E8